MALLRYFKHKDGLPDPKGSLSQSVPSQAIAAATKRCRRREVEQKIVAPIDGTPQKNDWKSANMLATMALQQQHAIFLGDSNKISVSRPCNT